MIFGLMLLLAAQLAGEIAARALHTPAPGPVLGLLVLAFGGWLYLRTPNARPLDELGVTKAATALTANLGLLFVPAGVGIVQNFGVLRANATAIVVALVASLALTLVVTVKTFVFVKRLQNRARGERADAETTKARGPLSP